jgi:hypothetical protein
MVRRERPRPACSDERHRARHCDHAAPIGLVQALPPPQSDQGRLAPRAAIGLDVAPLCNVSGCPWDPLPITCTNPLLSVVYQTILSYSGAVQCGNLLVDTDLGAAANEHTLYEREYAPNVRYPSADPHALYSLVMLDPDGNTAPPYNFPLARPGDSTAGRATHA